MQNARMRALATMQGLLRSPSSQYLTAVVGVLLVTLLRLALEPWLRGVAPYAFYFPLLGVVAWAFELGPTLLAMASSAGVATYLFVPIAQGPYQHLAIFVLVAGSLGVLARLAASTRRNIALALGDSERSHIERARLAAIVDSSDDAIIAKNLNGVILSWNAGAERVFGYTAEEMVGHNIIELIPKERRFEEDHILLRLRRGERIEHFETVRLAKDGREIDISLSVSPIRNAAGEIVGASKIGRDVTDRKRAERAVTAQRELLRVTLSSIGDAVVTTDARGHVTFMNPVAERFSGFSLDEALGLPISDVFRMVHERERKPIDDLYLRVVRSGAGLSPGEGVLLIARDGRERWVEDRAAPLLDEAGTHTGMVACFRDVSDRRRAEAALAEQREWLETTLVSIGDAVIATDIRGVVSFMNPVAEHMTGWKSEQARGAFCSEVFRIVNEHTRAPVESPVARVLREGVVVGLANHTLLLSRDGREQPIDDSAAPIRNAEGRISGVVLVFHDVTERRRAEAERQKAEREREQLLGSERAARSEAERANRLKDQFLATVSHELRTPLNAMLGWADMLKRNPGDSQTLMRGLTVIDRNARIQAQLVSDLLDVSRIVSGKLKLELQLVDLPSVVDLAIETVRAMAEAKQIQIERSIEPGLDAVVGDPDRLQQIVWNLLSNAVKFTPDKGSVSVSVAREADQAVITVTDNGAGIAADFLPHLFERFRQADSSSTRRHGGLGLGLTIVKQLAELHGGTIAAQSAGPGKGACFRVRLPLGAPSSMGDVVAAERLSSPATANLASSMALRPGLRILLVEDDADSRELVERLLTEIGCSVHAVASAHEAFELLQREPHELLISDIGLPDEDGYGLLARVRSADNPAIAHMPAIALTAFARSEDKTRALHSGFQAHVAKPLDPAELLATVTSFAGLVASRRVD
jgi:PAS domain S-box-containing protein